MSTELRMTSNRPYLIRGIYEWLCDNGMTPYLAVNAEYPGVDVPRAFVKNGGIVLNIAMEAVQKLVISNADIIFNARFGGVLAHIYLPIKSVCAIYAMENGRGMVFEEEEEDDLESPVAAPVSNAPTKPAKSGSHLKVVK